MYDFTHMRNIKKSNKGTNKTNAYIQTIEWWLQREREWAGGMKRVTGVKYMVTEDQTTIGEHRMRYTDVVL